MALALLTTFVLALIPCLGLFALGRRYERARVAEARNDAYVAGRRSMLAQAALAEPYREW